MKWISPLLIALFALLAGLSPRVSAQGSLGERDLLVIVILPDAVVDSSIVYLEQIAKINGGSAQLRQRVGTLDVAEWKLGVERMAIASEQVRFRLLLADIDPERFRMSGAKRTVVTERDEPVTMRKILAAADTALRRSLPGDPARITLSVQRGTTAPQLVLLPADRVRFEAKVRTPVPKVGLARVEVSILVNGVTREAVLVNFDIAGQEAPVLNALAPDKIRQAANFTPAPEKREVLVKQRDNVKLVARIGSAQVVAAGEAQEDGRAGDMIRVRNLDSNRVVHGRVEARGLVVVGD